MSEHKKSPRRLSRTETFKAYEILKDALEIVGPKLCKYKDGMDDESVAKMIAPDVTKYAIQDIRSSQFGFIAGSAKASARENKRNDSRIDDLESLFLKLSERVDKLESARF